MIDVTLLMETETDIAIHNKEIQLNLKNWNTKPLLQKIYKEFHRQISLWTLSAERGLIVELGSGIGNIKETIPSCLRTDLFSNPWIDQTENAYKLTFQDASVATIILFDVFHHLQYPGTVFEEFKRVLIPGGRVIIFDPCISVMGLITYGLFHHEPIGLNQSIVWNAPTGWSSEKDNAYYAAQGNAYRVFFGSFRNKIIKNWKTLLTKRMSSLTYVLSGGYSKPALYPESCFSFVKAIEKICDFFPSIFAHRLIVVLEKP